MRIGLNRKYTLYQILDIIGATIDEGIADRTITHISTDTRELFPGDLFFPLIGALYDGEDYCNEANASGAIALSRFKRFGIGIESGEDALLRLAKNHLRQSEHLRHRICITGSVGKTTTKELTGSILNKGIKAHISANNYNNRLGLAHTILSMPEDTEALIIEMGMNNCGEIAEMSLLAEPTIAAITNISTAHIGRLGSREQIAKAKAEITLGMHGSPCICPMNEALLHRVPGFQGLSDSDKSADYHFTTSGAITSLRSPYGIINNMLIPDELTHIVSSVYFAIALSASVIFDEDTIRYAVSRLRRPSQRGEYLKYGGLLFFDDSYNSSAEAVLSDLSFLCSRHKDGVSALLGDILELGKFAEEIHYNLGRQISSYPLRHLFLYGKYAGAIMEGAIYGGMDKSLIFANRNTSSPYKTAFDIARTADKSEVILMKASHNVNIKRIARILEEIKSDA